MVFPKLFGGGRVLGSRFCAEFGRVKAKTGDDSINVGSVTVISYDATEDERRALKIPLTFLKFGNTLNPDDDGLWLTMLFNDEICTSLGATNDGG